MLCMHWRGTEAPFIVLIIVSYVNGCFSNAVAIILGYSFMII